MSCKPIRTGLVGVGFGGLTFHIPFVVALSQHFTLHAIVERNPAAPGGRLAQRFGAEVARRVKTYGSHDELVGDREVELVVVATPNDTHFDFARRALEAGKHVLVDKPVTATAAEARELGELAERKGLVLYPYQNCRFNADFLALRRLLALPADDPRSLGTLVEFESRYDRYRTGVKNSWKSMPAPGTGLTYDLGSHLVDQALVLFGRPTGVTAFIENIRGVGSEDVDDCFTIILHYPPRSAPTPAETQGTGDGGCLDAPRLASFTAILRSHTLSVRAPQLRFVARGTRGTYTKHGLDVQEAQLLACTDPAETLADASYGVEPAALWGMLETLAHPGGAEGEVVRSTWPSSERGDYGLLFADLARTIRAGAGDGAGGVRGGLGPGQAVEWEESAAVIEIIELAYQSAHQARTVHVPDPPHRSSCA